MKLGKSHCRGRFIFLAVTVKNLIQDPLIVLVFFLYIDIFLFLLICYVLFCLLFFFDSKIPPLQINAFNISNESIKNCKAVPPRAYKM